MITIEASGSAAEGGALKFLVRADPAPAADLTVGVSISGCELKQAPDSVKIAAGESHATLTVPTSGAGVGTDGCAVTARITAGTGYRVGADTAASARATVTPAAVLPEVSIAATAASVPEGSPVSFTLTAAPPPASDLVVGVTWSESGSFLAASRPQTVTIPVSGTATLSADTVDDSDDEDDGSVTVRVEAGGGYDIGSPSSAEVTVTDNDTAATGGDGGGAPPPQQTGPKIAVNVTAPASVTVGSAAVFTFTATPLPTSTLTVKLSWQTANVGEVSGTKSTLDIPTSGTATVSVTAGEIRSYGPTGSIGVNISATHADPYEGGDSSVVTVTITAGG